MKMGKMSVKICSIMEDLFFDIKYLKNDNFENIKMIMDIYDLFINLK